MTVLAWIRVLIYAVMACFLLLMATRSPCLGCEQTYCSAFAGHFATRLAQVRLGARGKHKQKLVQSRTEGRRKYEVISRKEQWRLRLKDVVKLMRGTRRVVSDGKFARLMQDTERYQGFQVRPQSTLMGAPESSNHMRMPVNPFLSSEIKPGHGTIDLAVLPPSTPVIRTLSYQYPLKLIAPIPATVSDDETDIVKETGASSRLVHTVFILSYGGGLVAGDVTNLTITLAPSTRLVLLTQGSTKVFKTPSRTLVSEQHLDVRLDAGSALCYLPDAVQPFDQSALKQTQVYTVANSDASLCACDWVCEGRRARGESWGFYKYISRNEIRGRPGDDGKGRVLLRDALILDSHDGESESFSGRFDGIGIFGTLILRGPLMKVLGDFFIQEFAKLPRIGARRWEPEPEKDLEPREAWRAARTAKENVDGLLWTAASVRGCVVIKFGAREVEGARTWLRDMLRREGSVERHFGERALLCLK